MDKKLKTLIRATLCLGVLVSLCFSQSASKGFTVEQILGFPSPDNLIASPVGSTVAWIFNERGVRNIYVASGPSFEARRVTEYTQDDGLELTQLTFSRDGKTIVYVRAGDHGNTPGVRITAWRQSVLTRHEAMIMPMTASSHIGASENRP